MIRLGVNIDHVATLRNARAEAEPEPITAVSFAELGGADQITVHLREDRRHINDRDLRMIKQMIHVDLNLEMAATQEMVEIAQEIMPQQVTLVPENREEITTEGGIDLMSHKRKYKKVVNQLQDSGLSVALFLDPDLEMLPIAIELGAEAVELHTGRYALSVNCQEKDSNLTSLSSCAELGERLGLVMNAGHGLNYANVHSVAKIPQINELNIGHSIISRSIWCGLENAVREMKNEIYKAVTV